MDRNDDQDGSEKLDALDRYERMVDVQIEALHGIDDKAEYLTRYVTILIALAFTGASFFADEVVDDPLSTPAVIALSIGVGALLVSLFFAILTYLSSVFRYGPKRDFALDIANQDFGPKTYSELMLRAYRIAIYENLRVVRRNSKRFKTALTSLLIGVLFLAAAAVSIVSDDQIGVIALVIAAVLAVLASFYILTERYLTLEPETVTDDRTDRPN